MLPHSSWWKYVPDYSPHHARFTAHLHTLHTRMASQDGHAYPCFCSSERLSTLRASQAAAGVPTTYDRHCAHLSKSDVAARIAAGEGHVIRLKMPTGDTVMTDAVLGHVRFKNAAVDDTVLLKSDGFPTYHLACVVDDIAMDISHVIRGQEWLSSSPKHLALYAALGKQAPTWAHVPLLLDENRAKLSKRNNSASVDQYQAAGYLPESVVNWVALLGWHPGSTTEVMTMPELIEAFSVDGLNKANCVVDLHKLAWIQGHHIRQDMAASAVPTKPSLQLLAAEPTLAPLPRTDRAWQLWLRIQPHLEAAIAAAQATAPGEAATEAARAAAAAVPPAQLDADSIPEPPAQLSLSGHTWPTQYALAALQAQHVRAH